MINLEDLIKESCSVYKLERYPNGGVIQVPFFHWPESSAFYTVGIFEKNGKVYLTDLGTSRKYLHEKNIDIEQYKERLEKIKKEFDLYDGNSGSFNLDIYKPDNKQFVNLCLSRFLQALTFITRIEL